MNEELLARAARVRVLIMDVDGVMTDGTYWQVPDGRGGMVETKSFDSQDGIALKWLREDKVAEHSHFRNIAFSADQIAGDLPSVRIEFVVGVE